MKPIGDIKKAGEAKQGNLWDQIKNKMEKHKLLLFTLADS